MRHVRWVGGTVIAGVLLGVACGGDGGNSGGSGITTPDAGVTGGDPDGGTDAGADAGTGPTAKPITPLPLNKPANTGDWTFYGPGEGGPNKVFGASYDEGGNLWVAGGEDGLFVLRAGESKFQRFTMDDGLRPYGYMPDGSVPPGDKYLKVISVSGAWAGTAFVGYEGKPPANGEYDCESNWDGPNPDPAIYKSGDADRVTLNGTGIDVVHYDISSGPGIVGNELRGREKLCNILRIRYDPKNDKVWFGGNHGFAMGDAHYEGTGHCEWEASVNYTPPDHKTSPMSNEYGHHGCTGVLEHTHPALSGMKDENGTCCSYWTGGYYGVSVDPSSGDVWFGGQMRTTKFKYASLGKNYFAAQSHTEDPPYASNRIDIWPDHATEPAIPRPSDRVDDHVSGAAAMSDGSVWVSSFYRGLAHINASGEVTARIDSGNGLFTNKVSSIAADPADGSIWAGGNSGGGIARLKGGQFTRFDETVFGLDLGTERISDIQSTGSGAGRRMVVSFEGNATNAGAVGVYAGP